MKYYRVLANDAEYADRWFLAEPLTAEGVAIDARDFCYGQHYEGAAPAMVPIEQPGLQVAFTLAAFDMPVVTTPIADVLSSLGESDIERFPVTIGTHITGYEIVNATRQEKCVDESRSGIMKWGPKDDRPDKIGQYRQLFPIVIDSSCTNGRNIFRIWGWRIALIVSEKVKQSIESISDLGVEFQPVT